MGLPFKEMVKMVERAHVLTKEEGDWELTLLDPPFIRELRGSRELAVGYMSLEFRRSPGWTHICKSSKCM